jgi:hypothetical protein
MPKSHEIRLKTAIRNWKLKMGSPLKIKPREIVVTKIGLFLIVKALLAQRSWSTKIFQDLRGIVPGSTVSWARIAPNGLS